MQGDVNRKLFFETKNLIVRKFELYDMQQLYENHQEEEVRQWIPNEYYEDVEEARGAIEFYVDCVNQNRLPYVLAVELKENGELIGDVGICEVVNAPTDVEIGYTIRKKYAGNGYATELVQAMTKYVYAKFGSKIIYGRVMHGNDASVRVLEKNGYAFVTEDFDAEDDPYGKGMLIYKLDSSTLFSSL